MQTTLPTSCTTIPTRRLLPLVLLLSVFSLFLPRSAGAWNGIGHMVVAQFAYNHLSPDVKTRCDALIAIPLTYSSTASNTFVTAACWPDDFKTQLGTGTQHYIDIPFSLDATSTSGVTVESDDVVLAIRANIAILQSAAETSASQATALRYLIHYVGDIHQPLHCSTAVRSGDTNGDAGGNGFAITGTWSNLHSLWDAGGGFNPTNPTRPLSPTGQNTIDGLVATCEADHPFVSGAGTIPDPMDWAYEGWNLAQTVSYVGITRNTNPTVSYLNTAKSTAESRLALGGKRLADLLNTILGTTPVSVSAYALD
jgi:hypothetical protein